VSVVTPSSGHDWADRHRQRLAQAQALQGRRAGFASRLMANGIDFLVIDGMVLVLVLSASVVKFLFTRDFELVNMPLPWSLGFLWVVAVAYLAFGWSTTGKTIGKQVAGLRVVSAGGEPLRLPVALLRAAFCYTFWPGLLWVLVSRRNNSVQDVVLRTAVIYDWSYRGPAA
jgi:uncharacterized RDD family membrane protein YckC